MLDSHDSSCDTPEKLYKQGIEYLRRQSWKEAVAAFKKLVRIAPGYKDAYERLEKAKEKARKFDDLEDLYIAGRVHFEEEKWEAAVPYLERIVGSGESYRDADDLLQKAKKQLKLQTLYNQAASQLTDEEWEAAVKVLEEIDRVDRDYKDSRAKLDYARAQSRLRNLYNQALDLFREENWDEAIEALEMILRRDPDYLDAADIVEKAKDQKEIAALYYAGVGFLETGRCKEAIDKFKEINRRVGIYKDVADKLARAQRMQRLDRLFKQGTDHLRREEWEEAASKFEEVRAVDPDYRNVQARLEEVERHLRLEELRELCEQGEASFRDGKWREAVEIFEKLRKLDSGDDSITTRLEEAARQLELDKSYREGMRYFHEEKWREAKNALGRVARLDPDYRDVATRLKVAQERLSRVKSVCEFLSKPWWKGAGVIISILLAAITILIAVYVNFFKGTSRDPLSTPISKPATFCNGDFEDNFECWQHGGELDQSVKCDGDQCYVVLGDPDYPCYYPVPVGEAWIRQTFEVPQGVSPTLSLRYRVFSHDLDLPGYDYFQVAINGAPLPERYGNYEWDEPSCSREAWDSGWRTLTLDLSAYRREEVEVSFHSVNGTQPYHNTWTYVDDVRIGGVH